MTASQADALMAAIAEVAEVVGPYRVGCPEACETPEEAEDVRAGFEAVVHELIDAIRAIEAEQPSVVARWRGRG